MPLKLRCIYGNICPKFSRVQHGSAKKRAPGLVIFGSYSCLLLTGIDFSIHATWDQPVSRALNVFANRHGLGLSHTKRFLHQWKMVFQWKDGLSEKVIPSAVRCSFSESDLSRFSVIRLRWNAILALRSYSSIFSSYSSSFKCILMKIQLWGGRVLADREYVLRLSRPL